MRSSHLHRGWVLFHGVCHVAPSCFYNSPERTNWLKRGPFVFLHWSGSLNLAAKGWSIVSIFIPSDRQVMRCFIFISVWIFYSKYSNIKTIYFITRSGLGATISQHHVPFNIRILSLISQSKSYPSAEQSFGEQAYGEQRCRMSDPW